MSKYNFTIQKNYQIIASIIIALAIIVFNLYYMILSSEINCTDPEKLFTIPKGVSAESVANLLQNRSCLESKSAFKVALMITMKSRNIRSGRYDLKGILSVGQLIKLISSPSKDRVRVTLVEGWDINKFAEELNQHLQLDIKEFIRLCNNEDFIQEMGINAQTLEGFLFPDTYILLKTYTEEEVIEVLVNQFHYNYKKILDEIENQKTMTMKEVATLASIIQGEAIFNDEMPIISSVYHNRLDSNMLLQADPTIQYFIPGKPRRLFNKDLKINNPYNTYMYKGLPPGPINNPGLAAIRSALQPEETNYYYFVSNGEGRHIFSINNTQHNQAKLQLKKKRKLKKRIESRSVK